MGTKCCVQSTNNGGTNEKDDNVINKLNFIKKYPIGKGGFGRVINNYNIFNIIYYRFGKSNLSKIIKYMQ